jgi:hypothetical protein
LWVVTPVKEEEEEEEEVVSKSNYCYLMNQCCKHNGIPLGAHFMSSHFCFVLILYWPDDGYI